LCAVAKGKEEALLRERGGVQKATCDKDDRLVVKVLSCNLCRSVPHFQIPVPESAHESITP
jgi:hypothetical protein